MENITQVGSGNTGVAGERNGNAEMVENLVQGLAERFGAAVRQLTEELANDETVEYQVQGKWVVLSIYLHNSTRRLLNNKPASVIRGVLAHYLNTPYKIMEYPNGVGQHWFRVVALIQKS